MSLLFEILLRSSNHANYSLISNELRPLCEKVFYYDLKWHCNYSTVLSCKIWLYDCWTFIMGKLIKNFTDKCTTLVLVRNWNFWQKSNDEVLSQLRPKKAHGCCVQSARQNATLLWCEKKRCVLTKHRSHFHVSTGYLLVIHHHLFEGPQHCCNCKLQN